MGALIHCKTDDPAARYLNPVISVLKGDSAHTDNVSLTAWSSSSTPSLSVRNQHVSGESLVAYSANGVTKILAANNTGVTMAGTLGVTGATTVTTLHATGAVDFDTTLNVDGNETVGGTIVGASTVQGTRLISMVATGTAPLTVASTTLVTNLNAEFIGGQNLAGLDTRYVNATGDTMTGVLTIELSSGNDQAIKLKHNSGVGGVFLGGENAASPDLIIKNDAGTQIGRFTNEGLFLTGAQTAAVSTAGASDVQCQDVWMVDGANYRRILASGSTFVLSRNADGVNSDVTVDSAGTLAAVALVANAAGLDGTEELLVNGQSRLKGAVTVTTGGISVTGSSVFSDGVTVQNGFDHQTGSFTTANVNHGFFGATAIARPTVSGSRGGNAALADLCSELANLGLIIDSTTV